MTDLDIWDDAAEAWSSKVTSPNSFRSIQLKNGIDQLCKEIRDKRVLDAGCGDGVFTNYLASLGADVVGVDGSSKMIESAKTKYPNLNFQVIDLLQSLQRSSLLDKSFDLIVANMVLMHLAQINTFLSECKRLLTNGGNLVFSILHPCFNYPTMRLHKSLLDKLLMRKPSGLAFNYFQSSTRRFEKNLDQTVTHYHRTLEEYSKALNDNGFAITQMLEPHELDKEFLAKKPKLEYTTRLPRFLFIKAKLQ